MLAELGERVELTQPLAAACDDFAKGLEEGDEERTIRGYTAVETIVDGIRARFGYDLGRAWNKQEIDTEFDQLIDASALLVDRLNHEHLTDTDERNTYDLAVKIARGWARLVNGSYFLSYSVPFSEATKGIVAGIVDRDPGRVKAGVEQLVRLAAAPVREVHDDRRGCSADERRTRRVPRRAARRPVRRRQRRAHRRREPRPLVGRCRPLRPSGPVIRRHAAVRQVR